LINDGEHVWAYMGVSGGSLNSLIVQAMNLPVDKGAYIDSITDPNGPAGSAGMQGSSGQETIDQQTVPVGGDVVIAINGQPVGSFEDLLIYIALNTSPGDRVILTVIRDGKTIEVQVTLGERPNTPTSEIITP
jgi:2-alkenal reductase